jgi:class I fructose-bisphosphate aldolase
MSTGKPLRLRRIFTRGRALIVDCDPCPADLLSKVRLLARSEVDGIALTPGVLDVVAEELGALSVILRIDGKTHRGQQLISVQAAMEMGAEAVSVGVATGGPRTEEALERFGRVTEDARRLGMPVLAEVYGEDWLEAARLAADHGADVIQARFVPGRSSFRSFARLTGRAFLATVEEFRLGPQGLLAVANEAIEEAAHGLVLGSGVLEQSECAGLLKAVHALVHQGVSVDEALALSEKSGVRSQESEEG